MLAQLHLQKYFERELYFFFKPQEHFQKHKYLRKAWQTKNTDFLISLIRNPVIWQYVNYHVTLSNHLE